MCFTSRRGRALDPMTEQSRHRHPSPVLQTAAENAEVLAALAGGHDASSELFLYFTKLHIQARTRL